MISSTTMKFIIFNHIIVAFICNHVQANEQIYGIDRGQILQANQANNINQHNTLGHYEFEVAPGMEPPTVRKPPYLQSAQLCPGLNPFDGFSPKDTLCGNLNQGRVPMNPLGHSINGESYPFELIKNKTLQFLAKALPVLKAEYETIPKVARYLPTNQLLNPTHPTSTLNQEHMQKVNRHLATLNGFHPNIDELSDGYLTKRRRRRSVDRHSQRQQTVLSVAEMSPNATLVVSSAHSAGRIGQQASLRERSSQMAESPMVVITKDGYKPLQTSGSTNNNKPYQQQQTSRYTNSPTPVNWPTEEVEAKKEKIAPRTSGQQVGGSSRAGNNGNSGQVAQVNQAINSTPSFSSSSTPTSTSNNSLGGQSNNHANKESRTGDQANSDNNNNAQAGSSGSSQTSQQVAVSAGSNSQQVASGAGKQENLTAQRRRSSCADSGNGFTSTVICQAVTALIEGDRQPAWLQLVKHLGNAYSGASESPSSGSSPLWSILSGLAQEPTASKQSDMGNLQAKSNLMSFLGPLTSFISGTSAKDASSNSDLVSSQSKEHSTLAGLTSSTMTKLALAGWATNALASLVEYFVPSVFQSASRSFARRKKPFDPQETFVDTPASVAAQLSAIGNRPTINGMATKQPPTPCPSVEEYISPTFARNYQGAWKYVVQIPHEGYFTQTIQKTSCVKQKCEFTEGVCHESPRWVSLLVAEIYYPDTVISQDQLKDPMQNGLSALPSTSHIQQVANQYSQQQQQQIKPAQDPMQMTDSLNNYNHNLNNAFINAANELGLDPNNVANMQHLANAYNYQLLQRNGLMVSPQTVESRSSPSQSANYDPLIQAPANQPATSQIANMQQQQAQQIYTKEYIAALANAALQQNPNMNINDLIQSLQWQQNRKKRDLTSQESRQLRNSNQYNLQQNAALLQQRSGTESLPSMNDIGLQVSNMNMNNQQATNQMNYKHLQQTNTGNIIQQEHNQTPVSSPAAQSNIVSSGSAAAAAANSQVATSSNNIATGSNQSGDTNQVECDGHDKIGCYVVRVYYDWFLVNGSCKCWKTSDGQQTSSSSSGNSFLRRIFTGKIL